MHDMIKMKSSKRTIYVVAEGKGKKGDYFGHGNLVVGDCWPLQCVAGRDGAHSRLWPYFLVIYVT